MPKYASLVRANTRFWNSSGIVSHVSIFGGVNVTTPPLTEAIGQQVKVAVRDVDEIHLFHPESGARLEDCAYLYDKL